MTASDPLVLMDRLFKLPRKNVEWVEVNLDQYYQDESQTRSFDMKDVKQQEALITSLQNKLAIPPKQQTKKEERDRVRRSHADRMQSALNYPGISLHYKLPHPVQHVCYHLNRRGVG